MNLLRLKYFVEAAKCENFTEASKNLYTTQPNLSKQIAVMEDELGVLLFHRAKQNVFLTKAGRYLYDQLKDIPEKTEDAFEYAKALNRGEQGTISIGILEGQDVNLVLSDRIHRLSGEFPAIDFTLERDTFSKLRKGLDSFRYDVIITLSFELGVLQHHNYETLISQKGALAVSRKNPKAELPIPTLMDFRGEKFVSISPEESLGGYRVLKEQCRIYGFEPKIVRYTDNLENLLLCVETGVGVAVLDRNTRLEKNPNVRMISLPDSANADTIAVWKKNNNNPLLGQIIDGLKIS
ncbi:MAG TPA: LysR family transcriptional regulator [Clostridiales bacterium]|nr:LysR family transcriptional regulator [Clostridiales bacterium]